MSEGAERGGNKNTAHCQIPDLPVNLSSLVGTQQMLLCTSECLPEGEGAGLVQNQQLIGDAKQGMDDAEQPRPSAVQPWPFRQPSEFLAGRCRFCEAKRLVQYPCNGAVMPPGSCEMITRFMKEANWRRTCCPTCYMAVVVRQPECCLFCG